jgi:hypothetical protein
MKNNIFERHPVITITVFLAAVVFIVLLFDIVITTSTANRRHEQLMKYFDEKEKLDKICRQQSLVFHHGFKPNCSTRNVIWGDGRYDLHTNSFGFRDKAVRKVDLETNKHRILVIGDSFVEGVGVNYEKTFVGMLANYLEPRGIEVLDAGVVSYAPSIYYSKVKYLIDEGLSFDELLVFIDLSDIKDDADIYRLTEQGQVVDRPSEPTKQIDNIDQNSYSARENTVFSIKYWLLAHSTFPSLAWEAVRPLLGQVSPTLRKNLGIDNPRAWWTIRPGSLEGYGNRGLKEAESNMDKLAGLMKRKGIKMIVAVYPWPDQIFYHDLNSIQVRWWETWAKKKGVSFINLFSVFIGEGQEEHRRVEVIRKYYFKGDVHWNAEGHRKVYEAMKECCDKPWR